MSVKVGVVNWLISEPDSIHKTVANSLDIDSFSDVHMGQCFFKCSKIAPRFLRAKNGRLA